MWDFVLKSISFPPRMMSRVNSRGVPACANLWLGLIAAVCALLFPLEVPTKMNKLLFCDLF